MSASAHTSIMKGGSTPQVTQERKRGKARCPTPKMSHRTKSEVMKGDDFHKNMPAEYKLRRFYLPNEVAVHNTADNCWVSLFNQVLDLTQLIAENYQSTLCDPLVLAAGTDITHWFHDETREPKTCVDPVTGA